jgi:DNA-binding GntR family transcriptional regulator
MAEKVDAMADVLRQRVLNGEFGTSGRLPPHRTLAQQLGTTRETTNKVIQLLQSEGLLVSRDKSVYIAPPRVRMPAIVPHFDRYVESQGSTPVTEFLEKLGVVPVPRPIAKLMGLEEGTAVPYRLLRQGAKQGDAVTVYRLSENYYSPELVNGEILRGLQSDSQFDTLLAIKAKYGRVVVKGHIDAVARVMTAREHELLGGARGAPVLEVCRTNYAEDGTVVMVNKITFVGSLFELSYDFPVTLWS